MKLNFDTVRTVLLEIEEKTDLDNSLIYEKSSTNPDIFYTLLKLDEAQLINSTDVKTWIGVIQIEVKSLTYEGHKFLDTIRDPKVVKLTKDKVKNFSSVSIDIFSKVASQIILNLLEPWLYHSEYWT